MEQPPQAPGKRARPAPGSSSDVVGLTDALVKLNVGGTLFTSTKLTLGKCKKLDELLADDESLKDESGALFIDRSPSCFEKVLGFLRADTIAVPEKEAERLELLEEAQFYVVDDLVDLLSGRGLFRRQLGPLNTALRDREDELRSCFAQNPDCILVAEKHCGLIDVFSNLEQFRPAADYSWQELKGLTVFGKLSQEVLTSKGNGPEDLEGQTPRQDVPCSVGPSSAADFKEFFFSREWSCGAFDGLDMGNMIIAGGSVLAILLTKPPENPNSRWRDESRPRFPSGFEQSDFDFFLYGLTEAEAEAKIVALYKHLRQGRDVTVVRSKLAVTFLCGGFDGARRCGGRDRTPGEQIIVQVVLRIYKSPAEVLVGFDVDACCFAFDGDTVWATPRSRRALNGFVNVADSDRQSYTYESRLLKYALRGFRVVVPGCDLSKISADLYDRQLSDVRGLARLLLLERMHTSGPDLSNILEGQRERYIYDNGGPRLLNYQLTKAKEFILANIDDLLGDEVMGAPGGLGELKAMKADSDYDCFKIRLKDGAHPYGVVSKFIKSAVDSRDGVVPIVAQRNGMSLIRDAGGMRGTVTLRLWKYANKFKLTHNSDGESADEDEDVDTGDEEEEVDDDWKPPRSGTFKLTFKPSVPRRMEFVTLDPGRQMVGSFHPVAKNLFEDAYAVAQA